METNNQNVQKKLANFRKKYAIISSLVGVGVLGAGIGIGYGISLATQTTFLTMSLKTSNIQLHEENDTIHFQITFSKTLKNDMNVRIVVNAEYVSLFTNNVLTYVDSDGNVIKQQDQPGQIWLFMREGDKEANAYIKQIGINTLPNISTPISFDVTALNTNGIQFNQTTYLVLINSNTNPDIDENKIDNLLVHGDDMIPYLTPRSEYVNKLTSYFLKNFPSFPILEDDKLDLSNIVTYEDMMKKLHKYDNAESVTANILVDYVAMWYGTPRMPRTELALFSIDEIVRVPEFESEVTGPLFWIRFATYGWFYDGELDNTLFESAHENWDENWTITWDTLINLEDGNISYNQEGFANGLRRNSQEEYTSNSYKAFQLTMLKVIYGGLVSEWPTWMS